MQRFTSKLGWIVAGVLALLVVAAVTGVVSGGPLDPTDPPAETDGVRLPGTPISAPMDITAPGYYYLTRNITIPAQSTAFSIQADNVTLDLGGFTIQGDPGSDDVGIDVTGFAEVRIINGTIRDAETGINAGNATDVQISGVSVYAASTGFTLGAGAVLEDCIASGGGVGVSIKQNRVTVRSCLIAFNDGDGVEIAGPDFTLIERSVIKQNNGNNGVESGGIHVYFGSNETTARENDLSANGVQDIFGEGSDTVIVDNIISCPTAITDGLAAVNTFAPVNTSDPHTNRAHRTTC